jgi:hypothetical protein
MPKSKRTDVSGDIGAHLAAEMLAPIATVEARGETMELDFYCELRTQAGCSFHVQAKGSEAPTYGQDFITSLPISRKTVENYWLKQVYPLYILMADVRARRVFYLRVTKDNYEPGSSETGSVLGLRCSAAAIRLYRPLPTRRRTADPFRQSSFPSL